MYSSLPSRFLRHGFDLKATSYSFMVGLDHKTSESSSGNELLCDRHYYPFEPCDPKVQILEKGKSTPHTKTIFRKPNQLGSIPAIDKFNADNSRRTMGVDTVNKITIWFLVGLGTIVSLIIFMGLTYRYFSEDGRAARHARRRRNRGLRLPSAEMIRKGLINKKVQAHVSKYDKSQLTEKENLREEDKGAAPSPCAHINDEKVGNSTSEVCTTSGHNDPKLCKITENMLLEDGELQSPRQECSICLECFSVGESVSLSRNNDSCHHIFHTKCIMIWLKKRNQCPYCREVFIVNKRRYNMTTEMRKFFHAANAQQDDSLIVRKKMESIFCINHGLVPFCDNDEDCEGGSCTNTQIKQ